MAEPRWPGRIPGGKKSFGPALVVGLLEAVEKFSIERRENRCPRPRFRVDLQHILVSLTRCTGKSKTAAPHPPAIAAAEMPGRARVVRPTLALVTFGREAAE